MAAAAADAPNTAQPAIAPMALSPCGPSTDALDEPVGGTIGTLGGVGPGTLGGVGVGTLGTIPGSCERTGLEMPDGLSESELVEAEGSIDNQGICS